MPSTPERVPAFEAIGPSSALSGYDSLSNNSNVSLNSPNITMIRNTLKAIELQDKRLSGSPAILGSFRPALEKIGAVSHDVNTAASLKSNYRKLAKQIAQTNKILLETNTALCEWSKSFSSPEVSRLAIEISDYMKVHYGLNALLAERFENISLRLKAIELKETRRDKLVVESARAKRELDDFKKRSTDSNTISTLADKYTYKTQNLVAGQDLLESAVRSELRPALVGYAYSMDIYAHHIIKLGTNTGIDLAEFERKLKESDSLLGAKLNMSNSEHLKFPKNEITKRFTESMDRINKLGDGENNRSQESIEHFQPNDEPDNHLSETKEGLEQGEIRDTGNHPKFHAVGGYVEGGDCDLNGTLKRDDKNAFVQSSREGSYYVSNENDMRLRKKRVPNESNFQDSNDNVQEVEYPFRMQDNIWKSSHQ
jgi:hypothetical protein